jgi:outer membrane protein OmpA-like peptidoglycan-associated protein
VSALTLRNMQSALLLGCLALTGCDSMGVSGGSEGAPLDAQVVHPGGAVLQIVSIKVNSDRVLVRVRALNGRDREVSLNSGRENSYLLTDGGAKLFLAPPAGNPNLTIPAGQTMDGALVFTGALPRSGRATLVLNQNGSAESQYTSSPRFQIALPLDGAFGGGDIPEVSALSNMRANASSSLRPANATATTLGAGAPATSDLKVVEALKSELGAVQTERGTVVSLPGDVTFDFDKATIRNDAKPTLDRLAELIRASGTAQITIEGHTDAKGDDAYNKRLSESRAAAVKTYLASKNIDEGQLQTIGLGELRPVAPNAKADGSDDEAGRQRNRRVEVILPAAASSAAPAAGQESRLSPPATGGQTR